MGVVAGKAVGDMWGSRRKRNGRVTVKASNKISVLIVEDEQKLAESLQKKLKRSGYEAAECHEASAAEHFLQSQKFNIILLDLNLPGKSGFDFVKDLRRRGDNTPVLVISAREAPKDRITALDDGADDYMVKPFDTGELIARIESILRRSGVPQGKVLHAGDLALDVSTRVVTRAGKRIQLSGREYALLEFLLRHKNQILSRKRIVEQVWVYPFETGTNVIDVYISYLREAIEKGFSSKLIRTIHGEGFILMDPAELPVPANDSDDATT